MQPLDYTFEILLGLYCIYNIFSFWNNYLRVKTVKDDLVDRYVKLERIYGDRR